LALLQEILQDKVNLKAVP